jgi:hypothetical protein
MYGKPAMTCFKYQVYLYGLKAITYLSSIPLHPPLQAALPPCVWQHNLQSFEREL